MEGIKRNRGIKKDRNGKKGDRDIKRIKRG
jgi:hypothetical protein